MYQTIAHLLRGPSITLGRSFEDDFRRYVVQVGSEFRSLISRRGISSTLLVVTRLTITYILSTMVYHPNYD